MYNDTAWILQFMDPLDKMACMTMSIDTKHKNRRNDFLPWSFSKVERYVPTSVKAIPEEPTVGTDEIPIRVAIGNDTNKEHRKALMASLSNLFQNESMAIIFRTRCPNEA